MTSILSSYDGLAIDLDGVVWRGRTLLDGVGEAMARFRDAGLGIILLTNNGEFPADEIVERLGESGIKVAREEVMNSVDAALDLIDKRGLGGKAAWVVGPASIGRQVSGHVRVTSVGDGTPDLLIVGRDRSFGYRTLTLASNAVRAGSLFIALNRDPAIPLESGFEPGTGALVAAIESASGVTPTVAGKPSLPMMQAAAQRLGGGRVLMIGDSIHSDIAGARAMGWDSVLIGTAQPEDEALQATYLAESLSEVAGIEG